MAAEGRGIKARTKGRVEERGGQAISTDLACRPRVDRGIPGASLDWQPRGSYDSLFSRQSVSVKRRRLPHAPPERVLTCLRGRASSRHVRILAIEAAAPRRRKGSPVLKERFLYSGNSKNLGYAIEFKL